MRRIKLINRRGLSLTLCSLLKNKPGYITLKIMDISAFLYYQTACFLKLPSKMLDQIDGFEVMLGSRRYFFRGGETPFNAGSSISVASNKYCMNKILSEAGFPVPKAEAVHRSEFKEKLIKSIVNDVTFPVVVKPMIGTSFGQDVVCNITQIDQLKTIMAKRFKRHKFLSIEKFHSNLNSYRVLVFYNKVIGVLQLFPAKIVGDGIHSIKELIDLLNQERMKLKQTVSVGPMTVDEECLIRLAEMNITLDMVPEPNETIVLCYNSNTSRGGTMKSLDKMICKENARLFCRAAKALHLNLVGFDVACEDICIPIEKSNGVIIEANHNPDISNHERPMLGKKNPVSKLILKQLIWKHPLSYFVALYKNKSSTMYVKSSVLLMGFIACKFLG